MGKVIDRLLASDEPSIRHKARVGVLGEDPGSAPIKALRREIRSSPRVERLLSSRLDDGRIAPADHVYRKWTGAHWILATLADLGYPPGDKSLRPAMNQVFECWLNPESFREWVCDKPMARRDRRGVPILNGRARRCASQQGNALYSAVALGFVDDRAAQLAEWLIRWQWPDGGWNCDCRTEATHSSFWETLIPLRGLAHFAKATGDAKAKAAAQRASEVFLRRRLYRRERDGSIMNSHFVRLHYPCYWRYDILRGLSVMAEAGFIGDPRCGDALDLLESKRLPDGGWPTEERFWTTRSAETRAGDLVDWGGVSKQRSNEWVTAEALCVLKAAGRLQV